MREPDYIKINKAAWDARVPVHLKSDFYDVEGFLRGKSSLKSIERALLGNIRGKTVLHLQCHFGQDTISLARLGAKVTGVDFSEAAIEAAKKLAAKTQTNAEFICCDIYSLPDFLDKRFDIVFTSYGVIGWLPDMEKWAYIVSKYLNYGGNFVMVEFHPVVWMFNNDFTRIQYNYFKSQPIIETDEGTYTDGGAEIKTETVGWNHSLSAVVNSLIARGLQIQSLNEYDYSPYECFNYMEKKGPGKFIIKELGNKIPMLYSIKAAKAGYGKKSGARGV